MNYKLIYLSALFLNMLYSQLSFDQAKEILLNIQNPKQLPENELLEAEITIIDNNQLSAIITCDTLVKESFELTILRGDVVADFYQSEEFDDGNGNGVWDAGENFDDENNDGMYNDKQLISRLTSDIAFYNQSSSLRAERNVVIKNLQTSDRLSFLNPRQSEITWHRKYGTIASDKSFILEGEDGSCMSGNAFESNVDLTNVKVTGVAGGNYCK